MIKAVLCDMDGILYDSEKFYLDGNYTVLQQLGYTGGKEAMLGSIGLTMEGIYSVYAKLMAGIADRHEIIKAISAHYAAEPPDYKAIMFPDVPEALRSLRDDGILLACCSSSPLQIIEESLRQMGIPDVFAFVESGERVTHAKPAPDIYLSAAAALGVRADECAVYEDSDIGIAAGKAAGMLVIAREDHRFNQKQDRADHIVRSAAEMAALVRKENLHAGSHTD